MEKEKLAIIGASEFQNPLILKAKEMGFETHVFAWQAGDVGEFTADHFYPISITEKKQILEECRKIRPAGIVSIGSDLAVHAVCFVARALGLGGNDPEDMIACTNKFEMRRRFREVGIFTPGFCKVGPDLVGLDLDVLHFPVIVKPTDRSGSRGITKVFREEDLSDAIFTAQEASFEHCAIVEDYMEGKEYSFESISYHGVHHFLAVTEKFTTGSPHYIEVAHQQPSDLSDEMVQKAIDVIFPALDALKIRDGAGHAEFRVTPEGEIRIIEIGARMGGDCIGSDLVRISTGYDYVRMVIDVACGRPPVFDRIGEPQQASIHFIFDQEDLNELEKVKKSEPENIWRISEMENVGDHTVTDSSSRFGYYIMARPF